MAKKETILSAVLGVGAVFLAGYAGYLYYNPESEGVNRQNREESIAQAYIQELLQENMQTETQSQMKIDLDTLKEDPTLDRLEESLENGSSSEVEFEEADLEETTQWSDPNYYSRDGITYTPEYAMGELLGVLEVDRAGICRGVYGGSWEAIEHDLDIWMTTAARPDYEIGKTHFAIYGHNHTVQDLSFNRLKDVVPGDVFTYTTDQGVFIYDVTRFFADWRELVTRDYVDNFSISADKCYIISCGRNEYRYKDIVVEGTLRCVVDLADYAKASSYYKYEYDPDMTESSTIALHSSIERSSADEEISAGMEEEIAADEESSIAAKATYIDVSCTAEGKLSAQCLNEIGERISCEMALFDSDGLMVVSWKQSEEAMPDIDLLDDSDYVVGVVNLDTSGFELPEESVFRYHNGSIEKQAFDQEDNFDKNGAPIWANTLFFCMTGLLLFLLVLLLVPKKQ